MTQTRAPIERIKEWIVVKNNLADLAVDVDLIQNRLVDSLSFVEFVFLIQEVGGVEIDLDALDINDVRTLAAIEARFLTG